MSARPRWSRMTSRGGPEARRRDPERALPGAESVRLRDLDALYRAVIAAHNAGALPVAHGGVVAHAAWIQTVLVELREFERLVMQTLEGDGEGVLRLRDLLGRGPRLSLGDEWPSPPGPRADLEVCPIKKANPFDVVAAGAILDRLDGGGWLEKALGYYVSRVGPLESALEAGQKWAAGGLNTRDFAARFRDLTSPASEGHFERGEIDQPAGHGPASHLGLEPDHPLGGGPPFPDPKKWDPCTLTWGRCAIGASKYVHDTINDGDVPITVARVDPASVCSGYAGTLTLSPALFGFPSAQPPSTAGRMVFNDGTTTHPLTVISWSATSVTVQFPTAAAAGCAAVYWESSAASLGARLADALDSLGDTCANLFPKRPPLGALKPPGQAPARVAIVSAPQVTLTADGGSIATADACAPVALAWTIQAGLCGGNAAVFPPGGVPTGQLGIQGGGYAVVSLTANGQAVVTNVPLSGQVMVAESTTKTYTLTVQTFAGSTQCGSATVSVIVTRTAPLALSVPDRVYYPGRKVPVTVSIGCPAPAGGLQVTLTSANTAALASGSVFIAAGQKQATVQLSAGGTQFAQVQLTASAANYVSATTTVLVSPTSCLAPGSVPDARRYGGEWRVAVTIPQVVGIHMAALHTGEVLLFNYREGTVGGGAGVLACVKAAAGALSACDATWAGDRAACDSAQASGIAGCDSTFACSTAADCANVTCPPCTGGGLQRAACEVGRPFCLAACNAARLVCQGLRAVCKGIVTVAHAACTALAWASMVACKIGVVTGTAACALVAGSSAFRNWLLGLISAPDELEYNIAHASRASCVVWDPKANAVTSVPLGRNLFCSGHSFLADGRLFVVGGQFPAPRLDGVSLLGPQAGRGAAYDLNVFDPVARTWTRLVDQDAGRWYPTVVTLADGRVLAMSGNDAIFAGSGGTRDSVQIFSVAGNSVQKGPLETLPGKTLGRTYSWCEDWHFYHLYPFAHLLPNRSVFVHWKRRSADYYAERPSGAFPWGWHWEGPLYGGPCGYGQVWKTTRRAVSRTGPGPGTSVLLPLKPTRQPNGTITYPAARVMVVGGGGEEGESDPVVNEPQPLKNTDPATNSSEILDYGSPDVWGIPTWRWTGTDQANPSFMRHGRVMPDTVLLPDGKVLVVNGAKTGMSGGFLGHFGKPIGASNPALFAEIFDPDEESWDELCKTSVQRLYHATALLLPDARVAVTGHDGFLNMPQPNASRYEVEVFSPPYLFRGTRPVITNAPASISYGSTFSVDVNDSTRVGSVALLRGASVTHQTNTDQRYVGLGIHPSGDPKKLSLQAPPHGGIAPPGFYMLFIVDKDGVPSEAHWVKVG